MARRPLEQGRLLALPQPGRQLQFDGGWVGTAGSGTFGQVVERYTYDPYGKVTIRGGNWAEVTWSASRENPVLYCGYRYDYETHLYCVRHRVYHPTLGRWLQRDPEGYVDGMSLYEYVRSAPTGLLDASGTNALEGYEKDGWELEYVVWAYTYGHQGRAQLTPGAGAIDVRAGGAGAQYQRSIYRNTAGNRAGILWEALITMTKGDQRKVLETLKPHRSFERATFEGDNALQGKGVYVTDPRNRDDTYAHVLRMDGQVETFEHRLRKMKEAIDKDEVDLIPASESNDYFRADYFPELTPDQEKKWREEWAKQYEKGKAGTTGAANGAVWKALKESEEFKGKENLPPLPVPPDIHVPLKELKPGPVGPKKGWPERTRWPERK